MPIDFHCPQCNNLLRTPNDTAGRQAKCPMCGAVMNIPTPPPGTDMAHLPPSPPLAGAAAVGVYRSPILVLGDLIDDTWEIFRNNWSPCVVVVLIVTMINGGMGAAGNIAMAAIGAIFKNDTAIVLLARLVNFLMATIVQLWLLAGQMRFFLSIARRQPAEITDVFTGAPYIGSIFAASMLVGLMVFGVLMLFALPALAVLLATQNSLAAGITLAGSMVVGFVPIMIVSLMFSQFQYLIVDRHAGITESLEWSRQITAGNKLNLLGMGFLVFLINLGGLLACCVGILFTAPFGVLMGTVAYLTMMGQMPAPDRRA